MFASLTSFGGADLQVSFGKRVIGELQQISWAVQREKAPVFTLGSPDARSISRGKRGIGGSLVLAVFNRDSLMEEIKLQWKDIAPMRMFTGLGNLTYMEPSPGQWGDNTPSVLHGQAAADWYIDMAAWNTLSSAPKVPENEWTNQQAVDAGKQMDLPQGFGLMHIENIIYIDQLPPVDVTMTFANEYGNAAFQKIYDMDFLNEGSGVSVDTIIMERKVTWIARKLGPICQGVFQADNKWGNLTYMKPSS
jgi:hypothetical protein